MARQNKERVETYRLTLADDKTHGQLGVLKFTRSNFFVFAVSAIVIIVIAAWLIIAYTPVRTLIPGYPDGNSKKAAIQNAIKIDSLESIISRWDYYSENLRRVVEGQEPLKLDSIFRVTSTTQESSLLAKQDSLLRNEVKAAEVEVATLSGKQRALQIEGIHFFSPAKGTITAGFDKNIHPYIDITAPANTMVMSILAGTVLYSGWEEDGGYFIIIQHSGDIVSVYKHNQKLLKKTGDKVSAGTPIAFVGGTGDLSTGDHLHFELWHNGTPEDPTNYISF